MSDAMRIAVEGLRDLLGRYAREAEGGVVQRQDHMLEQMAQQTRTRLSEAAPRGPGAGPHLADLFAVSDLQRSGAAATIAVSNPKTVQSKAGRVWSLLDLLSGGTAAHVIQGNPVLHFSSDGADIFARSVQSPGMPANPFVQETVSRMDVQGALMRTARGVVVDLSGGSAEAQE